MTAQALRDTHLARHLARVVPGAVSRGPQRDADGHPLLALTVDDGPSDRTGALLDVLSRHGAPALFFLSGPRAEAAPDAVRQLAAAGHGVGNHGWHHASGWRRPAAVVPEMVRAEQTLSAITQKPVRDVRPPYGRVTPALVRWCRDGRRLVLWDAMPGDYLPSATAEAVASALIRAVRPGSIVALHDGPACTAPALDLALPRLTAAGWRFALP